jgi:transposase-like protein
MLVSSFHPSSPHQAAITELQAFIRSERDSRQVKKALAVKLIYQEYSYTAVVEILDVSLGSLSGWRRAYERSGLCRKSPVASVLKTGPDASVAFGAISPPCTSRTAISWMLF